MGLFFYEALHVHLEAFAVSLALGAQKREREGGRETDRQRATLPFIVTMTDV